MASHRSRPFDKRGWRSVDRVRSLLGKSLRLTQGRPVQSGAVAMKYRALACPRWRSIGWGADSEEVARAMAAGRGLGRVRSRQVDLNPSPEPRVGVDQKSHDQWVMSMSVMVSYDEKGEARDTASYCGARGPPRHRRRALRAGRPTLPPSRRSRSPSTMSKD